MWHKRTLLKQFYKTHKGSLLITLWVSLIAGILTLAIPVSIGKYYDFLFGYHTFKARLLEFFPFDLNNIKVFIFYFFTLVVLKTIFSFLEKYYIGLIGERFVFDIRNLLFQQQLKIPLRDYEEKGAGRYLLRFSGDMNSLKRFLTHGIIRFISDIFLISLAISTLFFLDWTLGIFMIFSFILPLVCIILLNKKLSRLTRRQRNEKSKLLSFTSSRLQVIQTIQLFNKALPEQGKFINRAEKTLQAGIRYQRIISLINALIPGILYLIIAGLFAFLYLFKRSNILIEGSNILVFIIILLTILPVFRRMLKVNVVWELGNISFQKLLNVLNRSNILNEKQPNFRSKNNTIVIDNLSFSYGDRMVFKNLNIKIPDKGTLLINGKPGSGKSTLIKLLSGLYHPTKGHINIFGQNTTKVNSKSLRKKITVVSENFPLFGETVFEAISYSRRAEKRRPVEALLSFLQENNPAIPPLTLDEPIGDLACQLSNGQRKLLNYARALLTNKPVILIDEPLSGFPITASSFWFRLIRDLAKEKVIIVFSSQSIKKELKPDFYYDLEALKRLPGNPVSPEQETIQ